MKKILLRVLNKKNEKKPIRMERDTICSPVSIGMGSPELNSSYGRRISFFEKQYNNKNKNIDIILAKNKLVQNYKNELSEIRKEIRNFYYDLIEIIDNNEFFSKEFSFLKFDFDSSKEIKLSSFLNYILSIFKNILNYLSIKPEQNQNNQNAISSDPFALLSSKEKELLILKKYYKNQELQNKIYGDKLKLLEKQNKQIIESSNLIIKEYEQDFNHLINIYKEKEKDITDLNIGLDKKEDVINQLNDKMLSVLVLEKKIKILENDFLKEKNDIIENYENKIEILKNKEKNNPNLFRKFKEMNEEKNKLIKSVSKEKMEKFKMFNEKTFVKENFSKEKNNLLKKIWSLQLKKSEKSESNFFITERKTVKTVHSKHIQNLSLKTDS